MRFPEYTGPDGDPVCGSVDIRPVFSVVVIWLRLEIACVAAMSKMALLSLEISVAKLIRTAIAVIGQDIMHGHIPIW